MVPRPCGESGLPPETWLGRSPPLPPPAFLPSSSVSAGGEGGGWPQAPCPLPGLRSWTVLLGVRLGTTTEPLRTALQRGYPGSESGNPVRAQLCFSHPGLLPLPLLLRADGVATLSSLASLEKEGAGLGGGAPSLTSRHHSRKGSCFPEHSCEGQKGGTGGPGHLLYSFVLGGAGLAG